MDLARRALDVNAANLALGNRTLQEAGATFVVNREHPRVYDANHVTDITVSSAAEIDALLARAEEVYEHCVHRRFHTDYRTPPGVAAHLALQGYTRDDALVMLLEGELAGTAPRHEIRPVRAEEDWQAYAALHDLDWKEYAERQNRPAEPEVAQALVAVRRSKQPPVEYWLACVDGSAAGYLNSWAGIDGVGQVEDLFVLPQFRRRGVATALIHHGVAACRRKGAGPVVIVADPTDTPKQMYAAMGFRPVAVAGHYLKKP